VLCWIKKKSKAIGFYSEYIREELTMVEHVTQPIQTVLPSPPKELPLIEEREIKAILYLGLRGDISLPIEERKVDIFA
jgi:hypothetical protein